MTGRQRQIVLAALFPLIFIPAFILAYFAFGAVNQDEYIQTRRLEDSLLLELDQVNSRVQYLMEELKDDLFRSLPEEAPDSPALWAARWEENRNIVDSVFVLSESGEILFPELDDSEEAHLFYWRYLNFFSGKEAIPVYRSIAEEYSEVILSEEPQAKAERSLTKKSAEESFYFEEEIQAPMESEQAPPALSEMREELFLADEELPAEQVWEESYGIDEEREIYGAPALRSKEAESLFGSDPQVQERVYELAEQEGQVSLRRNVLPQLNSSSPREEETQTVVRSVYIESTRYFEEMIQSAEYGLIPRLFDSTFTLLFWARQGDRIVGAELNMTEVNNLLVEAVAVPANNVRYLNILDKGGLPLIPFPDKEREQWRRPFVAKEMSEYLPYWEAAILLKNPEEFEKELESSRLLLTFMITALSALLLTAMVITFRLSSRQLKDVQERVGFVTNVTHELKTPLTSIRLYSEMLSLSPGSDPERVKKYSGYIASESQRLTRLINNVLDFSKWDRGTKKLNKERVDLNLLARDFLDDLREEYEKAGFTLIFTPAEGELPIWADREAVVQVLLNLLSNARKYSEDVREIRLETGRGEKSIYLSVTDRGIGIPRKYRKKIFREFYRIDTSLTSRYKGTGLGLAIGAGIMKNHGGRLTYGPREKGHYTEGSRFTLHFPSGQTKEENP
ncbi:MAG: HAMP domain-containing sensor histidine kinase [Spirochaetales bacterium]|nr:HAMP domain-containing sensor histidine kinase [Spirochaetales bacterium]